MDEKRMILNKQNLLRMKHKQLMAEYLYEWKLDSDELFSYGWKNDDITYFHQI
jgi:hypothetical protein